MSTSPETRVRAVDALLAHLPPGSSIGSTGDLGSEAFEYEDKDNKVRLVISIVCFLFC